MTPPAAPSSPPDMPPPSPDTVPPVGAHDERDWPRCHNGLCGVSPFVTRREGVSRVVCEAAVRFAWLMDPDISSAKRLVRAPQNEPQVSRAGLHEESPWSMVTLLILR